MAPEGLYLFPDFLSDDEEAELAYAIDNAPWQTDLKRRVQHYGWRYDYSARRVAPSDRLGPLPAWMTQVLLKLDELKLFPKSPEQAIVNEYLPGQGIAPHIDCVPCFGPVIASLSLCSACEMRLDTRQTARKAVLHLPRKSLLLLTGPARYDWQHAIAARKTDPNPNAPTAARIKRERRISITFRSLA
ncbi:MAG: alpha-ketoglutarate-dependent dioxygenase AlkB [Pseudomonadota bacterium]